MTVDSSITTFIINTPGSRCNPPVTSSLITHQETSSSKWLNLNTARSECCGTVQRRVRAINNTCLFVLCVLHKSQIITAGWPGTISDRKFPNVKRTPTVLFFVETYCLLLLEVAIYTFQRRSCSPHENPNNIKKPDDVRSIALQHPTVEEDGGCVCVCVICHTKTDCIPALHQTQHILRRCRHR